MDGGIRDQLYIAFWTQIYITVTVNHEVAGGSSRPPERSNMKRTEINEIKKQLRIDRCSITEIAGCYVSHEKEIISAWRKNFLSLDEEDIFKYLDIFRKCITGKLQKNLFNIHPDEAAKEEINAIKNHDIMPEEIEESFYQLIIEAYEHTGNYLILTMHAIYDVPGVTKDGIENEDASDEVYDHMIICICPVNLSLPGLGYNKEKSVFTHVERDWVLGAPEAAILYPAFNDRSEDRDSALCFVRSIDEDMQQFVYKITGFFIEATPKEEKDIFSEIIDTVIGPDASIRDLEKIYEEINHVAEEIQTEDKRDEKIGVDDIRMILTNAGIGNSKIDRFDEVYSEYLGRDKKLSLSNIVHKGKNTIKTEYATVSTNANNAAQIMTVDGKRCLVMPLEDMGERIISFNGHEIRVGGEYGPE